jgi:FAD/FMN-containing dehydrogenase
MMVISLIFLCKDSSMAEQLGGSNETQFAKDDLDGMSAEVLGDPTALAAYAGAGARYTRIERQLADEGLSPPNVED